MSAAPAQLRRVERNPPAVDTPERLIDSEGERLVIGNILAHPGFFRRVGPQLCPDDFAVDRNRRVFELAQRIDAAGGDPELSTCYRALLDDGKNAEEMGLSSLSELAFNDQIEIHDPGRWVRKLREKAAARRIWRAAERLRTGVESGMDTANELASARDELRLIEGSFDSPAAGGGTLLEAVASIGVDNLLSSPRGMIASPWEKLNNLTNGGPRPGELWLVGARTGVGKSTCCLQWALTAASAGIRVLFVSLEMPRQDLLKRTLSAEGDIPHGMLVRGELDATWRYRVTQTFGRIGEYPLEITDKLRSLPAIVSKVSATPGIGLLVVDYLGLVESGGRYENRNQEVSAISRRLKLAALDYNVPIIAAHQLNRANESENRRPQLSDLRDSGSLEQDADAVILLDAPAARKRNEEADKDAIEMLIAKQRNGVRGYSISLQLEGKFCRMVETNSKAMA